MIDTLKLRLSDVELSPNANFRLCPGEVDGRTGEVFESILAKDTQGNVVMGVKAKCNVPEFNLTLSPLGYAVQTSLPKLASKDGVNFSPLDDTQAREQVQKLEALLLQNGYNTRLQDAGIMRADIFKNGTMDFPTEYYFPLLRQFSGAYRMKVTDYTTGLLFKNGLRQVCFYDKCRDIISEHKKLPNGIPPNVLRAEMRLLDKDTVRREFGKFSKRVRNKKVFTSSALLNNWGRLEKVYNSNVNSLVFKSSRVSAQDLEKQVFASDVEKIRVYASRAGRNAWNYVKGRYGLDVFAERYTKAQFEVIVRQVFPRMTASRAIDEFIQAQLELGVFDNDRVTASQLLAELIKKVA